MIVLNSELNALNVDARNADTERPTLGLRDSADDSSSWGIVLIPRSWVVFMRFVDNALGLDVLKCCVDALGEITFE